VGNIHSGGSGKTPLVRALAEHFSARKPVVLSRGYRAVLSGVGAKVELNQLNGSKLYGDEPWMLAHQIKSPVFISKRRVLGIKKIEQSHEKSLVILDDGFQHLSLRRNVDLVCINTDKDPEENFCLPLGELREPVSALAVSSAVVLTPGASPAGLNAWQNLISKNFPELPCFVAEAQFQGFFQGEEHIDVTCEDNWVSFCGVAAPERFIAACKAQNSRTEHIRSFPDHYNYQDSDIDTILQDPRSSSASVFVTTEKDWYKVNGGFKRAHKKLVTIRYGYRLPDQFWFWLENRLQES
jgi:tetraacyldisaccharide 4'-kinase